MERVLTSRGVATRRRIVEGAAGLMRERGPVNVGLDDIREVTATSKSQLFHYFPDGKSALLLAVARFEAEQVLVDQMPFLGDLTSWRKLQAWRKRVVEKYADQRGSCPLSALTAQLGLADPDTREILVDLYARWHGFLEVGVRALKVSGDVDAGVDPAAAAVAIVNAVTGGATMLVATDRIDYLEIGLGEVLAGLRRPGRRAPVRKRLTHSAESVRKK